MVAFWSYQGNNTSLVIPNSVKTIGDAAFISFSGNNITLGTGLTRIDRGCFSYTGIINVNRTETEWNAAISSGDLVLDPDWRNLSSTLVYNQ